MASRPRRLDREVTSWLRMVKGKVSLPWTLSCTWPRDEACPKRMPTPPCRAGLVVLARVRVGVADDAAVVVGPAGEALEAVGVEAGVEQDDHLAQQPLVLLARAGGEVVGDQGRDVAGAGLVAVDAVTHPG